MAVVSPKIETLLVNAGKLIVPDDVVYDNSTHEFGRETKDIHVTLKYGYVNELTDDQIYNIIGREPKRMILYINGLSLFKNEEFDVCKWDIQKTKELMELRSRCDQYENEDEYPDYKPHSTIAYCQKDSFTYTKSGLKIPIVIDRYKYSMASGQKKYFQAK